MYVDSKVAVQRPEVGHYTGCGNTHRGVSDAQDSLIAAIGGTATAIEESTAASGFIDNFVQNIGHITIAMGEATFLASAYSAEPGNALTAVSIFLDIWGADIIFEYESAQSPRGCTTPRQPLSLTPSRSISADGRRPTGRSRSSCNSPSITRISHSGTKLPTVICTRIRRYRGAWRQRRLLGH